MAPLAMSPVRRRTRAWFRVACTSVVTLVAMVVSAAADVVPPALLSADLIQQYASIVSGDLPFDHVARLSMLHRLPASKGFEEAAAYIERTARGYGLSDVAVHSYTADGEHEVWTWRTFPAWEAERGELTWVSPGSGTITSVVDMPVAIAGYSQSADVTAEVIDVGFGFRDADYAGKDIRGKLVFTTGFPSMVHQKAVTERGAVGIITWYNEATQPDAAAWLSLPAWNVGDALKNPGPRTFAFVLSFFQGRPIKQALDRGQVVRLRALVKASTRPGHYQVVTATIPGTHEDAGELWFTAHLDHQKPGANDNASGAAAILEVARSLKTAIDAGVVGRPRATLRFLWGPEMIGNVLFLHEHPDLAGKVIGAFNLDTVGEHQLRLNSSLWVVRPPLSRAHHFADVVENLALFTIRNNKRLLGGRPDGPFLTSPGGTRNVMNGEVVPYVGGSDHLVFNDGAVGIPSMAYIHYPDPTWHTNTDKIENVDATTLERVVFMTATAALALAWPGTVTLDVLLRNSLFFGDVRLAHDRAVARPLAASPSPDDRHSGIVVLEEAFRRERQVLESLRSAVAFTRDDAHELDAAIANLAYRADAELKAASSGADTACTVGSHLALSDRRPVRTGWKGPLDQYRNVLSSRLGAKALAEEPAAAHLNSVALYEALNWANGALTLRDIFHRVAAECMVQNYPLPEPAAFASFFALLEKAGLITWQ